MIPCRRWGTSFLVVFMLTGGLLSATAAAPKIPKARLSNGVYTSPEGEYSVKIPSRLWPGSRSEERQTSPQTQGVFFADDFGHLFYILLTDNSKSKLTLQGIGAEYTVGELLREKEFVETERGTELRLVGINQGGSPVVKRTKKGRKWVEEKEDLIEAWSLFLHGEHIFQVTAGTPLRPSEGRSEAETIEDAKQRLAEFLEGLDIKSPPAQPK